MKDGTVIVVALTALLLSVVSTCLGCVGRVEVRHVSPYVDYSKLAAAEERVYRLKVFCLDGKGSSGSAVDLGLGVVATAKHITDGREECLYSGVDIHGNDVELAFVYADPESDLSLLVSDTELSPIEYADPVRYLPIWAVGFPSQPGARDQELTVSSGIVMGPVHGSGEIRISSAIYFGSSGGAVFDGSGRLVGISVSLYASLPLGSVSPIPYEAAYYAVPSSRVREVVWTTRKTVSLQSTWPRLVTP